MKGQRKKKKYSGKVSLVIKIFILFFLMAIFSIGVYLYLRYGIKILKMEKLAKQVVEESTRDTFKQTETSLIYDADGKILASLKGEKDVYYIAYDDIPEEAVAAIISIEDKKFNTHKGVDPKAILRAALAYVKNKGVITQGGSTITQQLARNIFLSFEESIERKVKEVFIARELEKKYSKKDIMEFYLNNIYFANGYYGIQSASFGYFGKEVSSLSLSQIAFLLSIPNSPNRYDPYENMEGILGRRDRILLQMKQDGKIRDEAYEEAINEKIKVKKRKKQKSSYMETFAKDQAVKALMKKDGFYFQNTFSGKEVREAYEEEYSEVYATYQRLLFSGGYRIYTSLEPEKQKLLQKTVDEGLAVSDEKSEAGVFTLQGSAVTIDNETGRVVAIVGGRSQNFLGSTLNRAYQSHRQPGSTIKPLVVYAPAFEGAYRPESIVKDEKIEKGPVNADRTYSGNMSILDAVAKSKNTIPWRIFLEISPVKGIGKLLDMKFSEIEEEDYFPAASLGGMSKGVSALELASAYSTLENKGIFREPTCIIKITDSHGEPVVEEGDRGIFSESEVYTEDATLMMTTCLEAVMTKGTGRRGRLSKMPCAGKTGTTNDSKDLWFAGFTSYYTTAIWVGYDLPKDLSTLPFQINPVNLWKTYMEEIHEGLEERELEHYILKKEEIKEREEEPKEEEEVDENGIEPENELKPETEVESENEMKPEDEQETEDGADSENEVEPENGENREEDIEGEEEKAEEDSSQKEEKKKEEKRIENETSEEEEGEPSLEEGTSLEIEEEEEIVFP